MYVATVLKKVGSDDGQGLYKMLYEETDFLTPEGLAGRLVAEKHLVKKSESFLVLPIVGRVRKLKLTKTGYKAVWGRDG